MAMTIQEAIGGELFRIETTEEYPLEHETLVNQAKEEQNEEVRLNWQHILKMWNNTI